MFSQSVRRVSAALAGVAAVGLIAAPMASAAPVFASGEIVATANSNSFLRPVDWNPNRRPYSPRRRHWRGGEGAVAAAALGIVGLAIANAARSSECDYGGCFAPQPYYAPEPYYAPPVAYEDTTYYAPPDTTYVVPAPVYAPEYRGAGEGRGDGYTGAGRPWREPHVARRDYARRYSPLPDGDGARSHR